MGGPFGKLLRAFRSAATWLTPAAVRRWRQRLLLNHPLAWRTMLPTVAWWSFVACAVAVAGAVLEFRSPADVATATDLFATRFTLSYLSVVAGVVWWVLQLRIPLGEVALVQHVKLFLLNTLTIFLLFLPGGVFTLAATARFAHSISDAEFTRDATFLRHSLIGTCTPGLTQAYVDANRAELVSSLARFGFAFGTEQYHSAVDIEHPEVQTGFCPPGSAKLLVVDAAGPSNADQYLTVLFRLESIEESKDLWSRAWGLYREDLFGLFHAYSGIALVGALIIGVLSQPTYAWRRNKAAWLLARASWRSTSRHRSLQTRRGHRLLLSHPVAWAAGRHLVPSYCALLALVIFGLLLLLELGLHLSGQAFDAAEVLSVGLAAVAYTWPYVWLFVRRVDLKIAPTAPWRTIAWNQLAAAVAPAALFAALDAASSMSSVAAPFLAILNAVFVLMIGTIRSYRGRLPTVLWTLSVIPLVLFSFAMAEAGIGGIVALAAVVVAIIFLASLSGPYPVTAVQRDAATTIILNVPSAVFACFIALLLLIKATGRPVPTSLSDQELLFTLGFVIASGLGYVYVLGRFVRVLARADYEPKRE
ncbi:MAG TPA: hypothetical protein VMI54_21510 [Polyangiaceae bacterium]|nr:hypothetical protein [Polyangiaceae bacterium]